MKLTQNQFLGLKKNLPLKFYEGASYIAVDTEEVYIYNKLEKPVLIGSGSMYQSKNIVFLHASNINAANIEVPTEDEVKLWNESLPKPYTDTIFYYNETDNSNLEATASFYVDNTGKIVRLGYKQEQEIDINRPANVYLNYQNQPLWYGWVPHSGNSTTIQDIVDHANDIGFTINKEVLALINFKVLEGYKYKSTTRSIVYNKYFFKKNNIEGDWGNGTANGPIVPSDLILISDGAAVEPGGGVNDVVIDLGDISTDDIVTYLNNNPQPTTGQNWEIDSSSDYWFSYTSNGIDIVDFYKGPRPVVLGNQIGSNYVVVEDDFQRISTDGVENIGNYLAETSNKVITLSLQDIGATDFEDDVKTKMLAYLQSENITIEAGVMPVIELNDIFSYNFEIEADWSANSVTDEASFVTFMDGKQDGSGVTVTDFILDGDWIRCNLSNSDSTGLDVYGSNIKKVISIGEWISLTYLDFGDNQLTEFNPSIALPSSLDSLGLYDNQLTEFNPSIALPSSLASLGLNNNQLTEFNPIIALPSSLNYLDLRSNQLTAFNPSISLPSSLVRLYLNSNQLTTTSYTSAETWATAQPAFTSNCNIRFTSNTDSITGTNLEAILLTKNVTITG